MSQVESDDDLLPDTMPTDGLPCCSATVGDSHCENIHREQEYIATTTNQQQVDDTLYTSGQRHVLNFNNMQGIHICRCSVYTAVVKGKTSKLIETLVSKGENINSPSKCGTTPLCAAVQLGYFDVVNTLLKFGADCESCDPDGNPPLCIAVWDGNLSIIETLAEFGADVNSPGKYGWTPLMVAAQQGNEEMIARFVELGADINAVGENGETALDLATASLDLDTAMSLVNFGADISSYMAGIAPTADIHDMFHFFCQYCNNKACSYEMFSLSKLMLSVLPTSIYGNNFELYEPWNMELACVFWESNRISDLLRNNHKSYVVRRKFAQIAASVFSVSLIDDARKTTILPLRVLARRYRDLTCFMFDEKMLRDTLALRLTCHANHDATRRFPVNTTSCCQELKTNLIESYVAHDVSQLVTSRCMQNVIAIHNQKHQ